jgi:hypothetical protein
MSKAYGLYPASECSGAPRRPYWIVDPNVAPDATVSSRKGSVPLWKRRGVACLASDHTWPGALVTSSEILISPRRSGGDSWIPHGAHSRSSSSHSHGGRKRPRPPFKFSSSPTGSSVGTFKFGDPRLQPKFPGPPGIGRFPEPELRLRLLAGTIRPSPSPEGDSGPELESTY